MSSLPRHFLEGRDNPLKQLKLRGRTLPRVRVLTYLHRSSLRTNRSPWNPPREPGGPPGCHMSSLTSPPPPQPDPLGPSPSTREDSMDQGVPSPLQHLRHPFLPQRCQTTNPITSSKLLLNPSLGLEFGPHPSQQTGRRERV